MRTAVIACLLIVASNIAHAQAVDVPGLIKLIENQPGDMDRSAWKEKRRDAARKLAQSKDKRATPELIKLAESETFDIIGEIAIEGLGSLGDPAAIPTLQKIIADTARDKGQRDLARKSLAKLGATPEVKPPTGPAEPTGTGLETATGSGKAPPPPTPPPPAETKVTPTPPPPVTAEPSSGETASAPSGGTLLGKGGAGEMPTLPTVGDDTLASYERVTFAGGTASLSYDTLSKELDFNADVSGLYQRRVENVGNAYGLDVGAHVVSGLIDPSGAAQSRGAQIELDADGEARIYPHGPFYAVGKAVTALQMDYISNVDDGGNANKNTNFYGDFQGAIGAGWGRVLDVGAAIRVRRISRTLDAARALGRPIDAGTSKKLQLTWWALRGERSAYHSLIATVEILREAGILLGEPDAGLTYELLNVLRDTQLFQRPSGLDLQIDISESYLQRPDALAMSPAIANGRVEQVLALATYAAQLDDDLLEVSGTAYGRLRLFAPMGQPSPWGVGAQAQMRRFTYGEHGDPFGVFDLTGIVALSDDDLMMSDHSLGITGELGFSYVINQASQLRLAAQVAETGGAVFIGGSLQLTYGLLDGTFAR